MKAIIEAVCIGLPCTEALFSSANCLKAPLSSFCLLILFESEGMFSFARDLVTVEAVGVALCCFLPRSSGLAFLIGAFGFGCPDSMIAWR